MERKKTIIIASAVAGVAILTAVAFGLRWYFYNKVQQPKMVLKKLLQYIGINGDDIRWVKIDKINDNSRPNKRVFEILNLITWVGDFDARVKKANLSNAMNLKSARENKNQDAAYPDFKKVLDQARNECKEKIIPNIAIPHIVLMKALATVKEGDLEFKMNDAYYDLWKEPTEEKLLNYLKDHPDIVKRLRADLDLYEARDYMMLGTVFNTWIKEKMASMDLLTILFDKKNLQGKDTKLCYEKITEKVAKFFDVSMMRQYGRGDTCVSVQNAMIWQNIPSAIFSGIQKKLESIPHKQKFIKYGELFPAVRDSKKEKILNEKSTEEIIQNFWTEVLHDLDLLVISENEMNLTIY
jgi:hypothetical protein